MKIKILLALIITSSSIYLISGWNGLGYFMLLALVLSLITLIFNNKKNEGCPEGQIECPNKCGCYDPNVDYVVDPCNGVINESA